MQQFVSLVITSRTDCVHTAAFVGNLRNGECCVCCREGEEVFYKKSTGRNEGTCLRDRGHGKNSRILNDDKLILVNIMTRNSFKWWTLLKNCIQGLMSDQDIVKAEKAVAEARKVSGSIRCCLIAWNLITKLMSPGFSGGQQVLSWIQSRRGKDSLFLGTQSSSE